MKGSYIIITLALLPFALATLYCPSANDFESGGGVHTFNRGWTTVGSGGVGTKSSFNLLGGWVSYNADFSGVPTGVNANIYSISPKFNKPSYTPDQYCDGQPANGNKPWCVEVDFIESNGNCGGQSTLHSWNTPDNNGGCGAWGCESDYRYNGGASFWMNVTFDGSGRWTVVHNGIFINSWNPEPRANDYANVVNAFTQQGAVIYSSQWVGWVPPAGGCPTNNGDVNGAKMTISNLQISGRVVQGPTPTQC